MDYYERKRALPTGSQERVKAALGLSSGFVSEVMTGKATPSAAARKVAVALSRKMKLPAALAFPEYFGSTSKIKRAS